MSISALRDAWLAPSADAAPAKSRWSPVVAQPVSCPARGAGAAARSAIADSFAGPVCALLKNVNVDRGRLAWDVRGASAVFNKILKWVAASLKRSEFGQFSEIVFSGPHQKVENLVQNAKILVIFPRYFIKNIAGDRRVQMFLITPVSTVFSR